MNNKNMLIELSEAFGPSGFEEEIKEIIVNEFKFLNSFTKHEDGIGSVIFSKIFILTSSLLLLSFFIIYYYSNKKRGLCQVPLIFPFDSMTYIII